MVSHRTRGPRRSTAGASVAVLVLTTVSLTGPPGSAAEPPSRWGATTTLSGSPVLSSPTWPWALRGQSTPPRGGGEDVRFRRRPPSSGWLAVRSLGRGGSPSLGVDGKGDVTALWFRKRPGLITEIVTARRPVGGTWSAPRVISRVGETRETAPASGTSTCP